MSVLYIVRHGQAAFFTDDYDRLSETGIEQGRRVGSFWREDNTEINEVYSGSLKRQIQTAEASAETYSAEGKSWPELKVLDELNEYNADQVMEKLKPELTEKYAHVRKLANDYNTANKKRQRYRAFHRLLEAVMYYYIAGEYESDGFETWREFHDRVTNAYSRIRNKVRSGRKVAVFTSGGPIGVSIQTCLNAPEQQAGYLNWRVYNASITQFTFSKNRISLDHFNSIGHLPKDLWTYR